jgi:predicted alpha/beta superfamily hydrolase
MHAQKIVTQVSSPRLKENREITIGLPASYDKNPDKKYPLLVLLDGDYLFDPFQGALNYGNYWEDLPEVIIVGISQNKNNEREIDCAVDEATGLPAESGEKFFEFISLGVIPYMQQKYRISPFKMIAGHDTTAGFMNFYLYKEDPLFTGYISLSPGLAQDMETHIPERLAAITKPIFYYQSTADGDVRKMQQRIRDLDKGIKAAKKESLNYGFDDFKGATHYSLVLHSIPNALYQFLQPTSPFQ